MTERKKPGEAGGKQSLDTAHESQQGQGIDFRRDDYGHDQLQSEEVEHPHGGDVGLVSQSDMEAPGGSSGTEHHTQSDAANRHRQTGSAHLDHPASTLSRGEEFDQAQGGGRDSDSVD